MATCRTAARSSASAPPATSSPASTTWTACPTRCPWDRARNHPRACWHASDAMSASKATYLDSSALVKLAVREPESAALRRYLRRRRPLIASALARTGNPPRDRTATRRRPGPDHHLRRPDGHGSQPARLDGHATNMTEPSLERLESAGHRPRPRLHTSGLVRPPGQRTAALVNDRLRPGPASVARQGCRGARRSPAPSRRRQLWPTEQAAEGPP
jgi:hypothetical protein